MKFQQAMMEMYKTEKVNPLGVMPAHRGADSGVHRSVLGAAGSRWSCVRRRAGLDSGLTRPDPFYVLPA